MRPRLVATLPPWRRAVVGIVPRRVAMPQGKDQNDTPQPVVVDWVWPDSPAAAAGLAPGMTVQADIATGSKSLFAYLLKPVYSSVNASFKER